jgi:hypothetical protein
MAEWRRARRVEAGVVAGVSIAALLLAACGGTGSASPSHRARLELNGSPQPWSAFPVDAAPRPLVFVGAPVVDPASGFRDGADKIAYIDRAIGPPSSFPSGPDRAAGYPIVSAKVAFQTFMARPGKGATPGQRLVVTTVGLGTGVFQTDRGPRRLPAWLFTFQGVQDPAVVVAVAPTGIFTPPTALTGRPPFVAAARLGPDDRTLTVLFSGAPSGSGPCSADYSLGVTQSTTTVAVTVHEHDHSSGVACAEPGFERQATTRLAVPLGSRVVLDAMTGMAVAVTESVPTG